MLKNGSLARTISDAAWDEFRSMPAYKAQWYGREVAMPLNVRTWTGKGGTTHDRDVDPARNILAAGPAVSVCGAGVRPQRSTPGGRSALKRKALQREP